MTRTRTRTEKTLAVALIVASVGLFVGSHVLSFGRILSDRTTVLDNQNSSVGAATFLRAGTVLRIEATGQEPVRLRVSTLHYPSETVTHLVQDNATRISLVFRVPADDVWDVGIENLVDRPNEAWLFVQVVDALPNTALAVAGVAAGAGGVIAAARRNSDRGHPLA